MERGREEEWVQVNPFTGGETFFPLFANVDDCTPFFTPGVWMSLFSLIILGLTLIFGLAMISSLKTMDKSATPSPPFLI